MSRDNVVLKQILQNPHHGAFLVVMETLSKCTRRGVIRLLLNFLDDPHAPSAAMTILANRGDAKFIHYLLRKDRSGAIRSRSRQNLKRIESISWLKNGERLLNQLDDASQHAVVRLVMTTGIPRAAGLRDDRISASQWQTWGGGKPARAIGRVPRRRRQCPGAACPQGSGPAGPSQPRSPTAIAWDSGYPAHAVGTRGKPVRDGAQGGAREPWRIQLQALSRPPSTCWMRKCGAARDCWSEDRPVDAASTQGGASIAGSHAAHSRAHRRPSDRRDRRPGRRGHRTASGRRPHDPDRGCQLTEPNLDAGRVAKRCKMPWAIPAKLSARPPIGSLLEQPRSVASQPLAVELGSR